MKATILGVASICVGGVVMVYGFLQPWKSCPVIDDSSAGCPADAVSNSLLAGGFVVLAAGVVVLMMGARLRRRTLR